VHGGAEGIMVMNWKEREFAAIGYTFMELNCVFLCALRNGVRQGEARFPGAALKKAMRQV